MGKGRSTATQTGGSGSAVEGVPPEVAPPRSTSEPAVSVPSPEPPAPDVVTLPTGRNAVQCGLCSRPSGSCPRGCPDESVLLSAEWAALPPWVLALARRLFGERAAALEMLQAERTAWDVQRRTLEERLAAPPVERVGRALADADDVVDVGVPQGRTVHVDPRPRPRVQIPSSVPQARREPTAPATPAPGGVVACSCKHLFGTSCPRCHGTGWVGA